MIKIIVKWYLSKMLKNLNNEISILTDEINTREQATAECVNATHNRDCIQRILRIL